MLSGATGLAASAGSGRRRRRRRRSSPSSTSPCSSVALRYDVRPDAGEAVGLQLEPDRELVGLRPAALLRPSRTCASVPSRFWTWWPISWAMT